MLLPEISFNVRLRNTNLKIKHILVFLTLFSLTLIYVYFPSHNNGNFVLANDPLPEESDKFLSLKAEIGYLRKKLLNCGGLASATSGIQHFETVFAITPTYARPVQKAELTRLANVFLMVPNLHWILVEDSDSKTRLVTEFLENSGIKYTHLNVATPEKMKLKPKDPHWSKPRGVYQRNLALSWLRENFQVGEPGVVYFADDDNSYTTQLFDEITRTQKVSVFPVGLVGGVMLERPVVNDDGEITGWSVGWGTDRPFAIDMAGFAINLSYLLSHTSAKFADSVKRGYQESEFLKHLVHLEDLEPLSRDKVLVWHTRTEQTNLNKEKEFTKKHGHGSDFGFVV